MSVLDRFVVWLVKKIDKDFERHLSEYKGIMQLKAWDACGRPIDEASLNYFFAE